MKNCCLTYLFFCSIAGTFVFIILGIFIYSNNPFLIIENLKKDENGDYTIFDEKTKKKAYLQYFIAALFDSLFALIIFISDILIQENKNLNMKLLKKIDNANKEIEIINSVGTQYNNDLINNENDNNNIVNNNNIENNNIDNEINTNIKGMSENEY